MAFGTAIHAALEYAQILTNGGTMSVKKVIEHYHQSLTEQYLPAHQQQRFMDHGSELLTKLLASETFWLGKGDLPEQSLQDVQISGARLKGVIDRINISKDHLTIIDYKTGKPLGSFITRDQNKAVKAWRHRTQLVFYALLVQNSNRFKPQTIAGQMWYVEASSAKELIREYIPSHEEIDRMARLVSVVWEKIQDLNLPDISNYSDDYAGIQNFEQDLIDGKI
jgi:RecB family exonuclease